MAFSFWKFDFFQVQFDISFKEDLEIIFKMILNTNITLRNA